MRRLLSTGSRPRCGPFGWSAPEDDGSRFEVDAVFDHLTIPKLAPEAYLRATVTNSSPVLLLPGHASLFHGAESVGATDLGTVATGEEFELHLGGDGRVRVERELLRRSTGKAMIGGTSRTSSVDVAYEVTVENHRAGRSG